MNGLIGFSGFVGSILLRQTKFDLLYRSSNIGEIKNKSFQTVVCAGASAKKWLANQDPFEDYRKIDELITHLKTIQCNTFVLISTVDVFKNPVGVCEASEIDESELHPYGLHRYLLEKFVASHFSNYLIVRIPGLVGPGLRKNVIFDLLNNNNLHSIDSRGIFQFYPMVNLWFDIRVALDAGLNLVHLTAEPISVEDIARQGFGKVFENIVTNAPLSYDMRTRHAKIFGAVGHYQYSSRETIQAVRAYAQSELQVLASERRKI